MGDKYQHSLGKFASSASFQSRQILDAKHTFEPHQINYTQDCKISKCFVGRLEFS